MSADGRRDRERSRAADGGQVNRDSPPAGRSGGSARTDNQIDWSERYPVAERLESVSAPARIAGVVAALLAYPIVFFLLFDVVGPTAWVVTYVPVVIAAVLVGTRGAFVAVAAEAIGNVGLAVGTGKALAAALVMSVPGVATLLIIAAAIGQYRDLSVRLRREIGEREVAQRRLRQTREELAILNRVVRHDIRNDMAITIGWGEELERHVDDEGAEMLDRMLTNSRHVVELTRAVRDFMAALDGDGESELEPIDLRPTLLDEIEKRDSGYEAATFVVDGEIPDVRVRANELLSSVFRNLLNNAVQHNDGAAPRVVVSAEEAAETVSVSVADDGPGIPADRRDAVFGRGDRGPDDPAAGIGLYLVDSLVGQYDGEVRIEDNEPAGTVFRVTLPKATDG